MPIVVAPPDGRAPLPIDPRSIRDEVVEAQTRAEWIALLNHLAEGLNPYYKTHGCLIAFFACTSFIFNCQKRS